MKNSTMDWPGVRFRDDGVWGGKADNFGKRKRIQEPCWGRYIDIDRYIYIHIYTYISYIIIYMYDINESE